MFSKVKSLGRVLEKYQYLRTRKIGFPYVGKRKDGNIFSDSVRGIEEGFALYDSLMSTMNNDYSKEINLTSGNPMKYKPFGPAVKEIKQMLKGTELGKYPYSEGDDRVRKVLLQYIEQEGFINTEPYDYNDIDSKGLSIHNLTFTVSTSHAFGLILDVIVREGDVVLMTSPNYGLFSFKPERINAKVELIPLEEKDGYLVNPVKLENRIKEINKNLAEQYKDKFDYVPRVVAFINANPNNPTGKVMGIKELDILKGIGQVCLDQGVFVIDDLVYRDLTYDRDNLAKPIASIPGMFRNTISLLGLSKSYGLAGLRAGFVVADEVIIRELINRIFQEIDAVPSIIGEALKGAFNTSKKRNKEYDKYFNKLNQEYQFRYYLLKAFVNGKETLKDTIIEKKVKKYLQRVSKNSEIKEVVQNGLQGICIRDSLEPQSGFFAILDFTGLRGKYYQGNILETEEDVLKFFYNEIHFRFIIGKSMAWPNKKEIMGRVTYAKEREDIINACLALKRALEKLDNK